MSKRGLVLFAALSVIWGLPYLFIAYAVAELDPAVTVFARTVPAAAILLAYSAFRGQLIRNLRFWQTALGFALVEMVFPWFWISRAEQELPSGIVGLLLATVPLFGVLIARLRGDSSALAPKRLLGLLLGSIGVVLIVGVDARGITPLPVLLVLLSALGYAFGPVVIERTQGQADAATMIGFSLAFVSLLYVPVVWGKFPSTWPSGQVIWSVVVLALVCTVAAFLVFFALIAEVGPMRATLVTYINPAVAVALGIRFAGEQPTLGLLLGFPVVLAGSWLASKH